MTGLGQTVWLSARDRPQACGRDRRPSGLAAGHPGSRRPASLPGPEMFRRVRARKTAPQSWH